MSMNEKGSQYEKRESIKVSALFKKSLQTTKKILGAGRVKM